MTPTKMTPPVKPPLTFPARPSPNDSSPSAASIAGATARLKNWYNRLPVQNQISTRHFFQAYSAPVMTNKQVLTRLNNLLLKAQQREQVEFYRLQRTFVSVPRPTETQCASLVSAPTLYQTRWDITSTTIRARLEAYMASPLADLTTPVRIKMNPTSPYGHPHFKHDTERRKHARHVAIARLSLSSFLDAYKAQVRMSKFDQNVREN